VIWNDTRNDPTATLSQLYYSYSTDGGQHWAANVAVSPSWNHFLGYPQQDKIGDYYNDGLRRRWSKRRLRGNLQR
jgi:hypothetical protein